MRKVLHAIVLLALPFSSIANPTGLEFVPNLGQWADPFLYKSGVKDCDIYLEKNGITYLLGDAANPEKVHEFKHDPSVQPILKFHAYKMIFEGANINAATTGKDAIEAYHNYYLGNDPNRWKTGIHPYGTVNYSDIYPGIDAVMKSDNGNFAYDFIVGPQADASLIKLRFEGVEGLELKNGKLQIHNSIKLIEESAPYTYQVINGEQKEVACKYVLQGNTISFAFPDGYDHSQPLVIDPTVIFVSFSGSTASNYGFSATYDAQGNAYGAGEVFSSGYPVTTGAFQTVFGGGTVDINISKYNSNGSALIYATYLGGNSSDQPHSMIVDNAGNLIVTGITQSANFPVTTGAFSTTYNGGSTDLLVTKFNNAGTALIGSTYVGGSGTDGGNMTPLSNNYGDAFRGEVICDATGNIYVAGNSQSSNFPTANAVQTTLSGTMDGVVFKLNGTLTNLLWSTYLGGSGIDGAVVLALSNTESNVYVSGGTTSANFPVTTGAYLTAYQGGSVDGYIARYNNGGSYNLLSATYLGTADYDQSYGVQVDINNGIYAMGQTHGAFPIVGAVYNNPGSGQFIVKLDSTLNNIQFSTIFGNGTNSSPLSPTAFLVDSCLNIYFSGWGTTSNFPITTNALMSTSDGSDFYFIALTPNAGNILFGSYYGGSGWDHVDGGTSRFDKSGIIYQAICSAAPTYPGSTNAVFPVNLDGFNVVTLKIAFELGTVYAVASANNASGCGPLTVQFNNTSQNATSYIWDFNDGSPQDTTSNPTHTFTDPGVYTVTLIANSTFACNFSDTTTITVTVDTGNVVSDFTYQIVDSCGPYTATFTNTSTVFTTNVATYEWDFGDNTTYNGANPPLHTYPGLGTYTVTLIVTDTTAVCGEKDTLTQTLAFTTFDVTASASPSPSDKGCAPFAVQFQNGSNNANSYVWNFGDGSPNSNQSTPTYTYTTSGTYTVMLISSSNSPSACKAADTAYLTIVVDTGDVRADFTAVVTDSCGPYTAAITNTSAYFSNHTTFTWNFGDGNVFTGPDPLTHNYPGVGTYTITLIIEDSTSCNKIDSISRTITFTNLLVKATGPEVPDICGVHDFNFSHQSTDFQSVLWFLGDGNTSTENSFMHHYDSVGTYNVVLIASNPLSCNGSDTTTAKVRVRRQAIADFTYAPIIPETNQPIDFTNLSQFADTYLWDFGDGSTTTEVNPSRLFKRTNEYTVCLTANNKDQCPDSLCRSVHADIEPLIDVPTAFTPDGDGMNDILYVRGAGVATVNLRIYNRWGKMIFETNSMEIGWDGTYKQEAQPVEAYAYILNATFVDGSTAQKQGNITLLR